VTGQGRGSDGRTAHLRGAGWKGRGRVHECARACASRREQGQEQEEKRREKCMLSVMGVESRQDLGTSLVWLVYLYFQ